MGAQSKEKWGKGLLLRFLHDWYLPPASLSFLLVISFVATGAFFATVATSPVLSATPASTTVARQTLTSFMKDLYAGQSQACGLADTKAQQQMIETGIIIWSYMQPPSTNPTLAQAKRAVPNCSKAAPFYRLFLREPHYSNSLTLTRVQVLRAIQRAPMQIRGKTIRTTAVTAINHIQLPFTLVLVHGKWFIDKFVAAIECPGTC